MEVFVPHQNVNNIYLEEIIRFSDSKFIFGNVNEYKSSFKIVNIHFPEAIFNWNKPTEDELIDLEEKLLLWKKYSKIVFTLNDIESHYDRENKFINLFRLIQRHADAVIHLGNYSLKTFKHLFSENCEHVVIYHPLYASLTGNYKTESFSNELKINLKEKYIVTVIGALRSADEAKMVFKIFNKIPVKNKFLVVPTMFQFINMPSYFPYRFRKIYRAVVERIFCYPLRKKDYFFGYTFLDHKYMVDLVEKSSLIIIPRIKNLNSGNLYLGLTFDKPMIIPKVGNLTEIADLFHFPVLDLQKNNFEEVIKIQSDPKIEFSFKTDEYLEKKKLFMPNKIAEEYNSFFNNLINKK